MKVFCFNLLRMVMVVIVAIPITSYSGHETRSTFQPAQAYAMADTSHNKLTSEEKSQGWELLFDGVSTKGWRTYQNKKSGSWSVMDGVLYCKASEPGKSEIRADLITDDQFENFELSVEWKISPKGNSGIVYRLTEQFSASHLSGPEYQIIDDEGYPQKLEDWQKTGANYAMHAAQQAAPNPIGSWNISRIVVNKQHVEHWLNGKKVVEYELESNDWKQLKQTGKWKDAPDYGVAKKGHIALQDHGSEAWFRSIKMKKL